MDCGIILADNRLGGITVEYKGKREIKIDDAVDVFSARAMSAILDDMELDFDLAVLDYADEEEMDVVIDGEEWVICFDQDEEGIHFHLITPEEFEDNYYQYAEYDEDDDLSFDDDDEDHSDLDDWLNDIDDDEDEYEGARVIHAGPEISAFHIFSLSAFLDMAELDFDEATITYADAKRLEAEIDGEKIALTEQGEGEDRYLVPELEDEEDGDDSDDDSRIIPFRKK